MTESKQYRWMWPLALCMLIATAAVLTGANLVLGNINQDEGWYLYAARMVDQGFLPYRHFAFTQAPVFPFVYGMLYGVVRAGGLAGGRLLTALFGLAAAGFAAAAAGRMVQRDVRKHAVVLCLVLTLINVYHSYYTSVVKTYSLSALFIAAGVWALTFVRGDGKNRRLAAAGAAVFFVLASGTRISAGILLPITAVWLLADRNTFGPDSWLWFGVSGVATAAAVFGIPYLLAPEAFWFCNVTYHSGRSAGGLLSALVYKAGFISRLVQGYFVLTALWIILLIRRYAVLSSSERPSLPPHMKLIWGLAAGVSAIHFLAPFPYEDYQVVIMPAAAALISAGGVAALRPASERLKAAAVLGVLLICACASFSSPINQEWMIRGRDRIWWLTKDQPDVMRLRDTARWIRAHGGDGDTLLTQDAYLAVEADMDVPPGLAMGPFSYYPDMPTEKADLLHVMNREKMLYTLRHSTAPLAAFSGYGLSIRSPEIMPLSEEEQAELRAALRERYAPVKSVEHFGQAHTTLEIYKLRSGD